MTHEELRWARLNLGLTQEQMAKMLETDARTLRKYEGGYRQIAARICRLTDAYKAGYRPKDWPTGN